MKLFLKKIYGKKFFLVLETFVIIVLPFFLISFIPGLYRFRIISMLLVLPYILFVTLVNGINRQKLGISLKNLKPAISNLFLPTVLFVLVILLIFKFYPQAFNLILFRKMKNILWTPNPLLYVTFAYTLFSAPLQELIFRGYLTSRLELVSNNKYLLIIYTSLTFMLIHFPSRDFLVITGTLVLGAIWEFYFLKYRNLLSVFLSHAIIGGIFAYNILLLINRM